MKKRMWSIVLCLTLVLTSMVGCGGTNDKTTSDASTDAGDNTGDSKGRTFGFTCMDGTNPFFVTIEKKIREQVEANGDRLISADPANDVSLQITQIEDMISQKLDGIFLNPVEADGILPALDKLKEAGVPILNFDTEVANLEYVASYVGSDNEKAGFVCGEDLAKKFPNGGPIIVLDSPAMNSVTDRVNGFLKAIEGKGFDIVAQQNAKGNLEIAMGLTEDLLQANSNAIAIFGGNDPTALGALAAANAAGLKEIKIYGVDGSPDIKKEIATGESLIEGTGAQSPLRIAEESVVVMYKIQNGEAVDAKYPVETFLITSENVNEFDLDGWQ